MTLSIGILGYGQFGAFLHTLLKRFAPEIRVVVYSLDHEPDGKLFTPLATAASSDIVVLAIPISAYKPVLQEIEPYLTSRTVLVDIATVKKYTAALIREGCGDANFISLHPMFGPESYAKRDGDVAGFRIAVTDTTLSDAILAPLMKHVQGLGFKIVEMTGDAHDKELAETLFLTHYIGQIVARGGFRRTDIDTVSFGYLMDAVDSVRHDAHLFSEVNKYNPYCADVIRRFDHYERYVKEQLLKPAENEDSKNEDSKNKD